MTRRDRRALIIAGAAIVLSLALRAMPAASRSLASRRDALAEMNGLLIRSEALVASRSAMRDSLALGARAMIGSAAELLPGTTPADAGANLGAMLSRWAAEKHAQVSRVEVGPDSAAGVLRRIQVRTSLTGDLTGLLALLTAIETDSVCLSIRTLSIDATDPNAEEQVLHADLTVEGWMITADRTEEAER